MLESPIRAEWVQPTRVHGGAAPVRTHHPGSALETPSRRLPLEGHGRFSVNVTSLAREPNSKGHPMLRFSTNFPRCCLGVVSLVSILCMGSAPAREAGAAAQRGCPAGLRHRAPTEVIEEHVALLQAGNLEGALCDFAADAVVILPGQIASGIDEIRSGLSGFAQLFGDAVPEIDSLTSVDSVVLLTFHVIGPSLSIPNGSDTYIVKKGLIRYQTVHDVIVPTLP
jgi:hypothetical protein